MPVEPLNAAREEVINSFYQPTDPARLRRLRIIFSSSGVVLATAALAVLVATRLTEMATIDLATLVAVGAFLALVPLFIRPNPITSCALDDTEFQLFFENGSVSGVQWNSPKIRIEFVHRVENTTSRDVRMGKVSGWVSAEITEAVVARARRLGLLVSVTRYEKAGRGGNVRTMEKIAITAAGTSVGPPSNSTRP